jgi:hypothetical protein
LGEVSPETSSKFKSFPEQRTFNFQEKMPMKKVVFTIAIALLLSSVGFAQLKSPTTYNRHAVNSCLGWHEVLQKLNSGTGCIGCTKNYVAGWTDLVDACGYPYNSSNVGQKHGLNSLTPPHYFQTGAVLDVGDAYWDTISLTLTGYQQEFILDLVDAQVAGYVSLGLFGYQGDYFDYFDYIAPGLPSKNSPNQGKLPFKMPMMPKEGLKLQK